MRTFTDILPLYGHLRRRTSSRCWCKDAKAKNPNQDLQFVASLSFDGDLRDHVAAQRRLHQHLGRLHRQLHLTGHVAHLRLGLLGQRGLARLLSGDLLQRGGVERWGGWIQVGRGNTAADRVLTTAGSSTGAATTAGSGSGSAAATSVGSDAGVGRLSLDSTTSWKRNN